MSGEKNSSDAGKTVPNVFNWKMVRKALRAAEEGVYCWNIHSGEIFYTEQCLRMMGLPYNEWAPNIFTQPEVTIHEEDRQFFINEVQKYLVRPTVAPLRVEIRLLNLRSRGWRWIRVNGLIERDKQSNQTQLVGVWVDITRRKMADMHAMEDRDLFRNLINMLPDNIYYKNRESRFVMANEATARKMRVTTPSDLIGCKDTHFFKDDTTDVARKEEEEIMRTGIPITNKIYHETWKGGTSSWCRLSKFPWYDSHGNIKGIVGISSDITELIETNRRYEATAKELDERLTELSERNQELEEQISLAREIQHALQPSRIKSRHWTDVATGKQRSANFHHAYLPCAGVAGDCFAAFPVGDAGIGMLICDVMGHGVRAALIASVLRGLMEQVSSLANTPGLLLSSLNLMLIRILQQADIMMFASAFYIYLDLDTRRLTLSGAGHPAPIILSNDGRAILPPIPRSPALGLKDGAKYRESEIILEPGMKLMLYTDGLTEARNTEGEEIGIQRIMQRLEQNTPQNVREMIDITLAGLYQFTESTKQDDDICLLAVEFTEDGMSNPCPCSV